MSVWVKICGLTCLEDAEMAIAARADAIGLNLVPTSKRCISREVAREIAEGVKGRVEVILVVADRSTEDLLELRRSTGVAWLQLHGSEPPGALTPLLPDVIKAARVAGPEDVRAARAFGGQRLLCDSKVAGALGGTGHAFDPSLVVDLARERRIILAGGLTSETVASAVLAVRPWGVDVSSGVEVSGNPRRKDPLLVRRFVEAARGAA